MPGRSDALKDVGFRLVPRLHRVLMRVPGGKALRSISGMPVIEVTTTGRKSGLRRTTVLTAPISDENRIVVVASKGGDDRDPDWFLNLQANPLVTIAHPGTEGRPYRARVATAEEKTELWPTITSAYKGYAGYQKRTSRDIPVVICEPEANAG